MNIVVVNGENISLWLDPWVNHKSLADLNEWSGVHIYNSAYYAVSHIIWDHTL